jgi:hypothetical protein
MSSRHCDLCESGALIHETTLRAGQLCVRHLCRTHGVRLWHDALAAAAPRSVDQKAMVQFLVDQAQTAAHRRGQSGPPR